MNPEQRREILERMESFDDHELLRMVALEEAHFLPEALEIAREVLKRRNIKPLDTEGYYAQYPDEDPSSGLYQSWRDRIGPGARLTPEASKRPPVDAMTSCSPIRAPLLSFYSKPFYRHVAARWRGAAYLYLLLVLAVCWLPSFAGIARNYLQFVNKDLEELLQQIPAISILDGVATADVPQPHYIRTSDAGKVFGIIDTTGQVQSLDGVDAQILLTRTRLIMKRGAGETRIYDLSTVKSFSVDRDKARHWMHLFSVLGLPVLYLAIVVFSYAYRLGQALVFALIALAIRRSHRSVPGFAGVLSLALVAATPAIIVETGLNLLGIDFMQLEILILALAFGYLYFGLKSTERPSNETKETEAIPGS